MESLSDEHGLSPLSANVARQRDAPVQGPPATHIMLQCKTTALTVQNRGSDWFQRVHLDGLVGQCALMTEVAANVVSGSGAIQRGDR